MIRATLLLLCLLVNSARAQYSPFPSFVSPTSGEVAQLLVATGGTAAIESLLIFDDAKTCTGPRRVVNLGKPLLIPASRDVGFSAFLGKGDIACRVTFRFQPQPDLFYEIYTAINQGRCGLAVSASKSANGPYARVKDIEKLRYVVTDSPQTSHCEAQE